SALEASREFFPRVEPRLQRIEAGRLLLFQLSLCPILPLVVVAQRLRRLLGQVPDGREIGPEPLRRMLCARQDGEPLFGFDKQIAAVGPQALQFAGSRRDVGTVLWRSVGYGKRGDELLV